MASSFIAALGALRAHQSWIDVIGNNLANTNTFGFKSSRALFADLLSITFRPGTGPTGNIGGTNPFQVGLGAQLASVDRSIGQGALDATGRAFDLALLGRGFFAVTDGNQTLYSRVGAFGLDSDGNMIDLRSGFRVLDGSGSPFQIDTRAVLPPSATTEMTFAGNLPAQVTGPLAEELTSTSSFMEGTQALMSGSLAEPYTIPAGETWTLEIVVNGGAPQSVAIAGTGAPLTAQDVVDEINDQVEDVVASVGSGETIELESERSGLAATIEVDAGAPGKDLKALFGLPDFVQGSESLASASTDLSNLTLNLADYQTGDEIEVSGTDADGSAVVASFTYGVDGTTLGDLAAFLDSSFAGSTVDLDAASGRLLVTADAPGEASLSLALTDGPNQAGRNDWAQGYFEVTTNGTGPDTVVASSEVFDSNGTSHVLTFEYERQSDGSWNLDVSVPASEGTVTSGTITGIQFNPNGSILTPTSATIDVQFGTLASQSIALDLGVSGQFSGLTQFGNPSSVVVSEQDGFGAGELADFEVHADGSIEGFFTNGQTEVLGSFGVATFVNEQGLEELGNSYFRSSANTGARIFGAADANGAGEVVGGSLETSNVDTAQEFVRLIQAQRGFQANARVITVQDELLAEVVNVI
jgi:flagellar hook protein FlgE